MGNGLDKRRSTPRKFSSLDETDRVILKRLELDGRIANQDLAVHAGLSASACLHRVRRLEQTGIILRYRVELDDDELGAWLVLFGDIILTPEGRRARRNFEAAFQNEPAILEAHQAIGRADYLLTVTGPDASAWPDLIDRLDPEGRLIAATDAKLKVRTVKRYAGLPQLELA